MREFGWCYIGARNIANTTAKELIKDGGKIVSVWNRTFKYAEKFALKYNCKAYENVLDAIKAPGVNGVYINVIHPKHYEFAKLCLENHIPVLCEKSLTLRADETKELFKIARENNTYFSEAMWTWHNPVSQKVKEWIANKEIGEIVSAKGAFSFPLLWPGHNKRLTDIKLGGGVILDLGVYPIRYAYELFRKPNEIICSGKVKNGADLNDSIVFKYNNFDVQLGCSFTRFGGDYFKIKGTKGVINVPSAHSSHKAIMKNDKSSKTTYPGALYAIQFRNVEQEIFSEDIEPKIITSQSSIEVMEIMEECLRQLGVKYPEN